MNLHRSLALMVPRNLEPFLDQDGLEEIFRNGVGEACLDHLRQLWCDIKHLCQLANEYEQLTARRIVEI